MTVFVNGDSAWTTNEVTTEIVGGTVYINGTKSVLNSEVTLALNQYELGSHTYLIKGVGSVPGINESQAVYQSGSNSASASGGQIVVTGTSKTIQGSFDFAGGGFHVTGIFTAPTP